MEAMMAAIRAGDYAAAHEALHQVADVDPTIRAGIGAFLLALTERFDDAEQVLRDADLPALQVIVRGERQRLARWRDPAANGSLTATTETSAIPFHVAIACAFVHDNEDLASQAKLRLAAGEPIAGQLTLQTGETRRFKDITDSDDAIGRMLETYCGDGLLYFPFHGLRRIEVLPRTNFMDHLMPKVQITDDHGTALAYVPLLYAGSSTSPSPELRSGRGTVFQYLGEARRGHGQRDLMIDGGGLVGFHVISAIDFD
jgi:protein involved in temperature-dependent protein secretion